MMKSHQSEDIDEPTVASIYGEKDDPRSACAWISKAPEICEHDFSEESFVQAIKVATITKDQVSPFYVWA